MERVKKTAKQIDIERNIRNKRYSAYIPRFISSPFDEKLKKENKSFTDWLKNAMEKYLKKS